MSNNHDSFTVPYSIDHCLEMLNKAARSKELLKKYNFKDVDTKVEQENPHKVTFKFQLMETYKGVRSPQTQLIALLESQANHRTKITYHVKGSYFYHFAGLVVILIGLAALLSAKSPYEWGCYLPFIALFLSLAFVLISMETAQRRNLATVLKHTFSLPQENNAFPWTDFIFLLGMFSFFVTLLMGIIGLPMMLELHIETKQGVLRFYSILFCFLSLPVIYTIAMPVLSLRQLFNLLRSGKYEKVVGRLKYHKFLNPLLAIWTSIFIQVEGSTYLLAGFIDEAENLYRSQMPSQSKQGEGGTKKKRTSLNLLSQTSDYETLCGLGNVFMARRLYDTALDFFSQAQRVEYNRGGVYLGIAEVYLLRGDNPQLALENLVQAEKFADTSWLGRMFDEHALPRIYAARAWAYAQMQQFEQAENAIMQALEPRPRDFYPGQADLHYKIGQTKLLMNDPASAKQHFQLAADFDPNGYSGNLARQALNEL